MKLDEHIPNADEKLKSLIISIADTTKMISDGFLGRRGKSDTENIYGEKQAEMDKWADEVLIDELKKLPQVASVSSEERPEVIKVNDEGEFSVTMDPLDGSSLLDVNLSVGTIIGIFRNKDPFLPGREMVGAMYSIYGPLTTMTYTVGLGVHEFILGKDGQFRMSREDIKIPRGKIYSPGGYRREWLINHLRYMEKLEEKGYKLRFSGCFASDVHQILHKGGVFSYPALKERPNGKLRLLFEGMPMGVIIKNAGGRISDGKTDLLEIEPEELGQRVPIYVGGEKEIEMIEKLNAGEDEEVIKD